MADTDRPFVSVIVPAFNAEKTLPGLFASLAAQTYPRERFEVIIVDNRSTDRTAELLLSSGFIAESEIKEANSYAARNRGIGRASGDVMAFTDADCRADAEWLSEGVKCLEKESADLAAGEIVATAEKETLAAGLSRHGFQRQEQNVRGRGIAATGNLLVRRRVFERIGPFDTRLRFGGDVDFTARARDAGLKIVYCPLARVDHPSHSTAAALIAKWWRHGAGEELTRRARSGRPYYAKPEAYLPPLRQFIEFRREAGIAGTDNVGAYLLIWGCKMARLGGNLAVALGLRG